MVTRGSTILSPIRDIQISAPNFNYEILSEDFGPFSEPAERSLEHQRKASEIFAYDGPDIIRIGSRAHGTRIMLSQLRPPPYNYSPCCNGHPYMLCFYNMIQRDTTDLVFKALAAPTRRELLDLLKDRPKTTGELCEAFPELNRCTVMQHLKVLEGADLIIVQRQGRERWNYLNPLPIKDIHDRWIGSYAATAVTLLSRLSTNLSDKKENDKKSKKVKPVKRTSP